MKNGFGRRTGGHLSPTNEVPAHGGSGAVVTGVVVLGLAGFGLYSLGAMFLGGSEPSRSSTRSPVEMAAVLQNADPDRLPRRPEASSSSYVNAIGSFDHVSSVFEKELGCGSLTPASMGMGRLWGCEMGRAKTAKLYVNEGNDGQVSSIKVLWNDWTRDIGYGLHADRNEALRIANTVWRTMDLTDELRVALMNKTSREIEAPAGMTIAYSYSPGPSIDERMVTITAVESPDVLTPRIAEGAERVSATLATVPPTVETQRSASASSDAQFERLAKDAIRSQRYWCEGRVSINLRPFRSTVNRQVYRAFCDDGLRNATYDIENDRGQIRITEARW